VKDLLGGRTESELNTIGAFINAVFIAGSTVGGFLSGVFCDKAGRKRAVVYSIACLGIFTSLTGYMPNWWAIVICRFFSGAGLGAILVVTATTMMEEWPEKTRAIFMGILSIAIPVGIFSAGLIDYFVSSWRQAFLVGIIPVVLAVIAAKVLKESDQWLKSQSADARSSSKIGGLFGSGHRKELITGSIIFGSMLIGLWAIFSWLPTWIQTLVTEGDAQKPRGIGMMMIGVGGLVGGFLSGWLTNAIGPRKSMLLCFAVCIAMCFGLFKFIHQVTPVLYAGILVFSLFFGASQGVLSVYIPGLFATAIRGMATGFCFNIGRVFTAVAVLFVGVLVDDLGGYANALFTFSLIFLLGFIATWMGRDKGTEEDPALAS
jgi:MFS family permease